MKFGRILLSSTLLLATAVPSYAISHARRGPTSPKLMGRRNKASAKRTSQTSIDSARTTEIQTALIKSGYLSGEPTGAWDTTTQAAMQKLQADNGWQTKLVPDSRAIIKLGLGPNSNNEQSLSNPTPDMQSISKSTY
jgi:hypothetical protein